MAKTINLDPIETIEEAMLNPGGDELDTHLENENTVIHDASQMHISPIEESVTTKLVNLIRGYYHSPEGVYPLTEFFYGVTDTHINIYDRKGVFLLKAGIGSFTMEEIQWILENLPQYITGESLQDPSLIHIDFTILRNEGWLVWRRSGTYNNLIGYIRKNLMHIHKTDTPEYYFDERADVSIVSKEEKDIINKFIQDHEPTTDVTAIQVNIDEVNLLIGQYVPITIIVLPLNATNREYEIIIDDPSIVKISNNKVVALDEGMTNIHIVSVSNPEVSVTIPVNIVEYRELLSRKYTIVRESEYPYDHPYIIGMPEGLSIEDFLNTFRNRLDDLIVYDLDGSEIDAEFYYNLIMTGMSVGLEANGTPYDNLTIIIRGDINQDGMINEYDKQCIRDHVNGTSILEGPRFIAADVDFNHVVNLDDLNKIERYLRGEINNLNS